ncbi:S8 family serine peptidase [Pontibacter sp. 13R65]|uniref:S8 family serine peptidase n=1 Tax=Pontibacter sp. 13R65 TaxID=3127458 RepID=UPI00301DFF28
MREILICFLILVQSSFLLAQGSDSPATEVRKRLVYFTDKSATPFSIANPSDYLSQKALDRRSKQNINLTTRDLPVDPAYVAAIKDLDVPVWYTSKWFNGVVVECSDAKLAEIETLSFVKSSQTLNRKKTVQAGASKAGTMADTKGTFLGPQVATADEDKDLYGLGFHQANMVGAVDLHKSGSKGEGITIAVLDAGFPNVNTIPAFSHLFEHKQVLGTFDFVRKQADVYQGNAHGTSVLSTMAAYQPNMLIGTAYKANYLLLRTEDAATEHHIEEINWLLAAEYADSAGADIINSSLGYTTFHEPSISYTYQDMDGNTALITKAADFAAATGMLVVVSAGNDGAGPWRYISAPADADSVLTVGAVDSLSVLAPFSSVGPTSDGRLKPDVVGMGRNAYFFSGSGTLVKGNGTSFSGPIVAGLAACLWQADPNLTNMELIELIRHSGSNASSPDNNIGYGIPNYTRTTSSANKRPANDLVTVTNPVGVQDIVLHLGEGWAQQEVSVQVYDVSGKLLFQQQLFGSQPRQVLALRPQTLKQGIYICRLISPNDKATLRFLKL